MRKLSLFLALVLLFSCALTAQAGTKGAVTYENFYCNYSYAEPYTNGVIVITGLLDPNVTTLTIPGEIAGVKVNIGRFAFEKSPYLKTVIIENGVEEIAEGAFYECKELATVFIPDSVKKVGSRVFEGCDNLNYAPIPEGAVVEEAEASEIAEAATEQPTEEASEEPLILVRLLAEKGNAAVSWNGEAREVTVTGLQNEVKLRFGENFINDDNQGMAIGEKVIYVNGQAAEIGTAPVIIDGATYIPKAVVDALFGNENAANMIWGLLLSSAGAQK